MKQNGYNPHVIEWQMNRCGLSLRELARVAQVNPMTVTKALAGKNVTTRKLMNILEALELDPRLVANEKLDVKDFPLAVLSGCKTGSLGRV